VFDLVQAQAVGIGLSTPEKLNWECATCAVPHHDGAAHQTIDVYCQAQALKPGMALEADVVQDRRKVWEWVAEPLLATTARVRNLSEVPNLPRPGG
jgi:hypothetical protein